MHEAAEVFAVAPVGDYVVLTVVAPDVAADVHPGQFVSVSGADPDSAALLRRSCPVLAATPSGRFSGTVQFVVPSDDGRFRQIARREVGATLDVIGPLGRPFPLPTDPVPAVLVGHGIGTASLIPLATRLLEAGSPIEFVIGAPGASQLFGELLAKRTSGAVTVVTGDGSAGAAGSVADVLPEALARVGAQVVYAGGPREVLAEVGRIAREHAIPAQVRVDDQLPCGTGLCQACVLPVRGDDGRARLVRACVDGPVFLADRVRFADVGRLPGDLVGAEAMGVLADA